MFNMDYAKDRGEGSAASVLYKSHKPMNQGTGITELNISVH